MTGSRHISIRMAEADIITEGVDGCGNQCLAVVIDYRDIEDMAGGVAIVDALSMGHEGEAVYELEDGGLASVFPPPGWQFGEGNLLDRRDLVSLEHLCGETASLL